MTSASTYQLPFKNIAVGVAGLMLALSLFFACFFAAVPQAHAQSSPQLTEPQIQSIINLLVSFNVDQATINNVTNVLHGIATNGISSLTVATDASSPSYQIVAGGSTGVTLGAFKLHATGEAINVTRIGLTLSQGKPADLNQVYLYNPTGTLLGTAFFTGNNTLAVSTLTTGLNVPQNGDAVFVVKGDIANIGTGQAGTPGDLITVYPAEGNTKGNGVSSGLTVTAQTSGYKDIPGVRIYKSYPFVTQNSLPQTGLEDGRLIRFNISANSTGSVGIGKFSFNMSNNVGITSIGLYGYTDPNFSLPIAGQGTGGLIGITGVSAPTNPMIYGPSVPIEIPPGQTYYFELRGTVAPTIPGSSATVKLLADTMNAAQLQSGVVLREKDTNFVWSPNDTTTSQYSDNDWTNGYGIAALYPNGISQTRTGGGAAVAPTCILTYSHSTISIGQTLSGAWSSTNATSRSYSLYRSDGSLFFGPRSTPLSGTFSDPNAASDFGPGTFTRKDTVTGPGGTGTCSVTITVATASTVPTARLSVTPTSGAAPLSAAFSVESMGSGSYYINYGDGQNAGPLVGESAAGGGSSNYRGTHTYSSAGTYTAALSYMPACPSGMACTQSMQLVGNATITVSAPTASTPPSTPTGLSSECAANGQSVSFSWGASSGATDYLLRTRNSSTGIQANIDSTANNKTYTYSVSPGVSYAWWLVAANSAGISGTALGTNFTCNPTPTCTMSFNPATVGVNQNSTFSWSTTGGATSFNTSVWGALPTAGGSLAGAHSGATLTVQGSVSGPTGSGTCSATLQVSPTSFNTGDLNLASVVSAPFSLLVEALSELFVAMGVR